MSGAEPESILQCVRTVTNQKNEWITPTEYLRDHVSQSVVKIVLGYQHQYANNRYQ